MGTTFTATTEDERRGQTFGDNAPEIAAGVPDPYAAAVQDLTVGARILHVRGNHEARGYPGDDRDPFNDDNYSDENDEDDDDGDSDDEDDDDDDEGNSDDVVKVLIERGLLTNILRKNSGKTKEEIKEIVRNCARGNNYGYDVSTINEAIGKMSDTFTNLNAGLDKIQTAIDDIRGGT